MLVARSIVIGCVSGRTGGSPRASVGSGNERMDPGERDMNIPAPLFTCHSRAFPGRFRELGDDCGPTRRPTFRTAPPDRSGRTPAATPPHKAVYARRHANANRSGGACSIAGPLAAPRTAGLGREPLAAAAGRARAGATVRDRHRPRAPLRRVGRGPVRAGWPAQLLAELADLGLVRATRRHRDGAALRGNNARARAPSRPGFTGMPQSPWRSSSDCGRTSCRRSPTSSARR